MTRKMPRKREKASEESMNKASPTKIRKSPTPKLKRVGIAK